jgi:two-component system response regulator PilR (NtrC family)
LSYIAAGLQPCSLWLQPTAYSLQPMTSHKALVVDDEPDIRELLQITLERMQIDVVTCGDLASATRELRNGAFDLCLTDMRLLDGDGLTLVEWIQKNKPQTPVAVITAHGNVESAVRALKLGAFDFISKPLDLAALRKLIAATLKLGDGTKRTSDPPETKLLGKSRAMEQLREMIQRVARSQAPVHICGESGTGKELVAQLIHNAGSFPSIAAPFLPSSWKANSSATAKAASPARLPTSKVSFNRPKAARCSWMRSPTCPCTCKSSSCA